MEISVLLVDDEKDFTDALAERLAMRGLNVSKAYGGEEALDVIKGGDTDVVILDMQMPGLDGVSVLREIKSIKPLTEVIMLTGHATIEAAVEGMRSGAFDFLVKPALIDDLVQKISKAHEAGSKQRQRIINAVGEAELEKTSAVDRGETDKLASIGELAAGIAHEINNPVAVMVGEAGWIEDLLGDESLDVDEIKKSLRQISIQGERCREITHKLLSFARRTDPSLKEIQLNDIISSIMDTFGRRSSFKNIDVEICLAPDLPLIYASPFEIQQVFVNLLNNAIDAIGDAPGTLKVATGTDGETVFAAITDSGPGIPEPVRARMFDPFFTTKPVGKGTGLGLSICYGIISKFGGRIVVETAEGVGSTFTVHLPPRRKEE